LSFLSLPVFWVWSTKTALQASSKTRDKFFCVKAEHSTYL
jgi:hypothetical protein